MGKLDEIIMFMSVAESGTLQAATNQVPAPGFVSACAKKSAVVPMRIALLAAGLALPVFPTIAQDSSPTDPVCAHEPGSGIEYETEPIQFHRNATELCRRRSEMACVSFSPDGRYIATGSGWHGHSPGDLILWDRATREIILRRPYRWGVRAIEFSVDGRRMAVALADKAEILSVPDGCLLGELIGHNEWLDDIAWSGDCSRIATCSLAKAGVVIVWDAATQQRVNTLTGHKDEVFSVDLSPDGKQCVSGGLDGMVRLWDVDSGKELKSWRGPGMISEVEFTHDGQRLAFAPFRGSAKLVDIETDETVELSGHTSGLTYIELSPDGTRAITATREPVEVKLWDAVSGEELATISDHTESAFNCDWSPDGTQFATASWDKTVRLYDVSPLKHVHTFRYLAPGEGEPCDNLAVAYSPDGRWAAVGDANHGVRIRHAADGRVRHVLSDHTDVITSVTFSPDSRLLASSSADGTVRIGCVICGETHYQLNGHDGAVNSVVFAPNGCTLYSAGEDGTVRQWQLPAAVNCPPVLVATGRKHDGPVRSLAISGDGSLLISGGADRSCRLWNASDLTERSTLNGHTTPVSSVVVTPDGHFCASGSEDGTVRVWDTKSGETVRTLKDSDQPITCLALSASGETLASAGPSRQILLWKLATGEMLDRLSGRHAGTITSVAFSPDNRHLISSARDSTVKLWTARRVPKQTSAAGRLPVTAGRVCLTSRVINEGKHLVTFGYDRRVRTWNLQTAELEKELLPKLAGPIVTADVSPDGRRTAISIRDKGVGVFNHDTGEVKPQIDIRLEVRGVSFSPDGTRLAVAGADRMLRVFITESGDEVFQARAAAEINAVAWSPDGRLIAGATGNRQGRSYGRLYVWSSENGEPVGDTGGVFGSGKGLTVAFSPDGKLIAMGQTDRRVTVFQSDGLVPHGVVRLGSPLPPSAVRFLPDSRRLAVGTHLGEVSIWDVNNQQEVRRFSGHAINPENPTERRRIFHLDATPDGRQLISAGVGLDNHAVYAWPITDDAELSWPK